MPKQSAVTYQSGLLRGGLLRGEGTDVGVQPILVKLNKQPPQSNKHDAILPAIHRLPRVQMEATTPIPVSSNQSLIACQARVQAQIDYWDLI